MCQCDSGRCSKAKGSRVLRHQRPNDVERPGSKCYSYPDLLSATGYCVGNQAENAESRKERRGRAEAPFGKAQSQSYR